MAIYKNSRPFGNIVTDGLILNLDAVNPASYPGTGTTWFDTSGNGRNATLFNSPTYTVQGAQTNLAFNGSNQYGSLGVLTGWGASDRTVDVWFQLLSYTPTGIRRIYTFAADDTGTDQPALTLAYQSGNTTLNVGLGGTPFNAYIYFGFSTPTFLSTWYNITATVVGNTISAYRNGVFVNSATNTGAVGANPIGYIARYNQNYGQNGNVQIANMKVYNRALSATEISQNYNALKSRFGLT